MGVTKNLLCLDNPSTESMVQFFYHLPSSKLPIRDVLGEQHAGHKTEPHIEIGAENFCVECYQKNIKKFVEKKLNYLFLITTCKNKEVNRKYGKGTKQFIVGYIIKDEVLDIDSRVCVKGPTHIYSFEDSILVRDLFRFNFDRSKLLKNPFVDKFQTRKILEHFRTRENILNECIKEIRGKDKSNVTCKYGAQCKFRRKCLRFL
jgi:hypothetical protein